MKKHVVILVLAMVTAAGAGRAAAQQPQKPAGEPAPADVIRAAGEQAKRQAEEDRKASNQVVPLEVDVVVTRSQGDKKISAQPYTLNVNATSASSGIAVNASPMTVVKIGRQVPLPNFAPPTGPDGKPIGVMTGGGPIVFKEVGTQIDCRAKATPDGRFEIQLGVQDTSVMPAGESGTHEIANLPVLKTFQATNNLVLRDGQSRQFVAATDPVSGQQVKVDVTVKVVK